MISIPWFYQTSFYIAAALLSVACLTYIVLWGRSSRSQGQAFSLLFGAIFLSSAAMIAESYFLVAPAFSGQRGLVESARLIYLVFHSTIPTLFAYYAYCVCGTIRKFSGPRLLFYAVPFIISEIIVFLNPLMEWACYYDSALRYVRQWGSFLLYAIGAFYAVLGFLQLNTYWKTAAPRKRQAMFLFILLVAVGISIQIAVREIQLEIFTDTLAALGLLLLIETENDRISTSLGMYNRRALRLDLENFLGAELKFHVIIVRLLNIGSFQQTMGVQETAAFQQEMADYLKSLLSPHEVYYANWATYVLIPSPVADSEEKEAERAAKLAETIRLRFREKWKGVRTATNTEAVVLRAAVPKDFATAEEVMYLVDSPTPKTDGSMVLAGRELRYIQRRREIEAALRRCLMENGFEVYYQPIYRREGLQITSAEALVRMHDSELGEVPPGDFIPVAEEIGMMSDIGVFVLYEVCGFLASGVPASMGLTDIHVNLSSTECLHPDFIDRVKSCVNQHGIDAGQVVFEFRENMVFSNLARLKGPVKALREEGFRCAMDGFDTLFPNLQDVCSLGFDNIKISHSILWNALSGRTGHSVLTSMVQMIRDTSVQLAVEGVSKQEHLRLLSEFGVDHLQGNFLNRAMPKDEFVQLPTTWKSGGGEPAARA